YQVIADLSELNSLVPRARRAGSRLMLGVAAAAVVLAVGAWFSFQGPFAVDGAGLDGSSAAQEQMFWESVKHSTDPAELDAYLERFPRGVFSELARARLEGLRAADQLREQEQEA